MGIPFYFKSIIRQHGQNIVLPLAHARGCCERLFFDFNCAIHQCAGNVVAGYSASGSALPPIESLYSTIIDETVRFLGGLIQTVQPKHLAYVAVDGVCPLAKMVQQRKRRYCSIMRQNLIRDAARKSGLSLPPEWDSNAITPGTTFMSLLNTALHQFSNAYNESLKASGHQLRIIVSDSDEAGEGEHKIMDYLRANPSINNTGRDLIYGLDADLIMLSMVSPCSDRILLLREKPAFDIGHRIQDTYLLLHIQNLKQSLFEDYKQRRATLQQESLPTDCLNRHINDYVLLCSLVGNDFIPPLSYMKIKENGIELLLNAYVETSHEMGPGQYLVLEETPLINPIFLMKVTEKLAKKEDQMMAEVHRSYYDRKTILPPKEKPIERAMAMFDNYPTLNKFAPGKIDPNTAGWRSQYYAFLFPETGGCTTEDICQRYLEGIYWIAEYYFRGQAHAARNWSYPFNYSPTALDLYNAMYATVCSADSDRGGSEDVISQRIRKAFKSLPSFDIVPALQLLYVLPPASVHLMKPMFQTLQTDITKGCVHYYPTGFSISTYLKYYIWEAAPMLPTIDIRTLHNAYMSVAT